MDQIKIENLEIFANHGVYPEENRLGQKFLVSCILYVDTRKAGKTDDLEASVNYGTISHLIKEKMEEKNYRLIEAVAEQLAEEILLFDEKIRKVMVEVKKPWAPVGLPLETVSVKIERCWNEAFIALGSNMGDKKKYIENAVEELKNEKLCRVLKVSKLIGTEPYGARLPSTRRYAEEGFPARPEPGAKLPNSMVSCHGESPLLPPRRHRSGPHTTLPEEIVSAIVQ